MTGIVQGVGFRAAVRRMARELGLVGWVRNTSEGAVEIVAEGEIDAIRRFELWCQEGPTHAVVSGVQIVSQRKIGELSFAQFEIRHSQ